ncbi:MAG: OmpH family outer membrane protein [Candidatus Kapaibacterium sp.]|nr:OmpH family outer membrane protein [Ignavibacteriota bacterium]MCB9220570.1 OmpH family outer membrane protein [Ignavibacteria bacterium]
MLLNRNKILLIFCLFSLVSPSLFSQRVAFFNSETIRQKFQESEQAEQRIQTIVDEWKREIKAMQEQINKLEYEIKKNRLIWSDEERQKNETDLAKLVQKKGDYATQKFQPGGEFDKTVREIQEPVEAKIYAAVQKVAAEEGFDLVLDQSVQPIAYANFKYDLTVKILKELGVDVKKMEDELKEKIDKDPRNQQETEKNPRRVRRR